MSPAFFDPVVAIGPGWYQHGLWLAGQWDILRYAVGVCFGIYIPIAIRLWKGRFIHPVSRAYIVAIAVTFISLIFAGEWSVWQQRSIALHDTYYFVAHSPINATIWMGLPVLAFVFSRLNSDRAIWLSWMQFLSYSSGAALIWMTPYASVFFPAPRRYVDYQEQYDIWTGTIALGPGLITTSGLLLTALLFRAIRSRRHKKNDTTND